MIKTHKRTLILTSIVTLLPLLAGLLLWNKLPSEFATHWGIDGQADGYSSLSFAVFFPPLIMLAIQWLCVWITAKDVSNHGRNRKAQTLVLWIIPVISNATSALMYALALGADFSVSNVMLVLMGLMFVVIGNYLPKCRQNSTIGIKLPWTYSSEENWNATHRMGGKIWVIGGLLIMLSSLLPGDYGIILMLISILVLTLIPTAYSYWFYKKEKASGKVFLPYFGTTDPRLLKGSLILVVILLIGVGILMFTGDIAVQYGNTSFTIEANYYEDLTVEYASIDSIEYRDGNISGTRTMGFGSARLLMGYFENEEFGSYTRYTYGNPGAGIVIRCSNRVLVLSGKDAAETQAIYQQLMERTGK